MAHQSLGVVISKPIILIDDSVVCCYCISELNRLKQPIWLFKRLAALSFLRFGSVAYLTILTFWKVSEDIVCLCRWDTTPLVYLLLGFASGLDLVITSVLPLWRLGHFLLPDLTLRLGLRLRFWLGLRLHACILPDRRCMCFVTYCFPDFLVCPDLLLLQFVGPSGGALLSKSGIVVGRRTALLAKSGSSGDVDVDLGLEL